MIRRMFVEAKNEEQHHGFPNFKVCRSSHKINCISTMKFEFFDPLSGEELKKRRVIIPEWIFTEDKEDLIPIKDSCAISPQDLLDVLSTPVALF